jgi:hypothetical protein
MILMFQNAQIFNPVDSPVYKNAKSLRIYTRKNLDLAKIEEDKLKKKYNIKN